MGRQAEATRMLQVLARQQPARLTRAQLATLSHRKVSGGSFSTYLSNLRRQQLITEDNQLLGITAEGQRTVRTPDPTAPRTAEDIRDQWRSVLRAGAGRILDAPIDAYPEQLSRQELADAAGVEVTGGTFGTYLSNLRTNGLAETSRTGVRATDVRFINPRP